MANGDQNGWLLNELASAIWPVINTNISDQLPNLFDSLNRTMCGGDMSPYSIMSVARNLCWGPDKRSAEGTEIEMLKASRREAYGDTPSPAD